MTSVEWSPVVYGRTRTVDRWWRALPQGVELGWAARAVRAVTAGGIGLDERSRFVLAQGPRHRLVGGACMARDLSSTMNTDGRRALYCFVGWLSSWPGGWKDVPALDELEAGFAAWAEPVYEHWMARDWDLHETQVTGPHESQAEPAPWRSVRRPDDVLPGAAGGPGPVAWPQDRAGEAWDVLRSSDAPGLLVAGWQHASDAEVGADGWIAAADVARVTLLELPASAEPDAPPAGNRRAFPAHAPEPPLAPADPALPAVAHAPDAAAALATPAGSDVETLVRETWSRVAQMPAPTPVPVPTPTPAPAQAEGKNDDRAEPPRRRRGRLSRIFGAVVSPRSQEHEAAADGEPDRGTGGRGREHEPDHHERPAPQ